jgi:hypothetical protein
LKGIPGAVDSRLVRLDVVLGKVLHVQAERGFRYVPPSRQLSKNEALRHVKAALADEERKFLARGGPPGRNPFVCPGDQAVLESMGLVVWSGTAMPEWPEGWSRLRKREARLAWACNLKGKDHVVAYVDAETGGALFVGWAKAGPAGRAEPTAAPPEGPRRGAAPRPPAPQGAPNWPAAAAVLSSAAGALAYLLWTRARRV